MNYIIILIDLPKTEIVSFNKLSNLGVISYRHKDFIDIFNDTECTAKIGYEIKAKVKLFNQKIQIPVFIDIDYLFLTMQEEFGKEKIIWKWCG